MPMLRDAAQAARKAFRGRGADAGPEAVATAGVVVDAAYGATPVRFFVADRNNEIQREHRAGRFHGREALGMMARGYTGGAVLDVGAGVGNHVLFAGVVLDAPKIIAIEPNAGAQRILELNVLLNGLERRVEILKCGLSATSGRASWIGESARLEEGDGEVRLEAGDDVVADEVGFIRIGAEGFEVEVLKGLARTIRRCRPRIFIEVEPRNEAAFQAHIRGLGYRIGDAYEHYDDPVTYLLDPA